MSRPYNNAVVSQSAKIGVKLTEGHEPQRARE